MSNNQNKTYQPKDKEPVKSVDSDYIEVIKCEGKPLVDVVENKETVEDVSDDYIKFGWDTKNDKTPLQITCKIRTECVGYNGYYLTEANAIEAIKKYNSQTERKRKAQVDFYKSRITVLEAKLELTHHNYASFVALIEAYKSEFNGFDIYNDDYTANVAHDTAMGVLTDLLNKIKL